MSILVNVQPRSAEWHKWRQWRIGASQAASIMGECPYRTDSMLYDEIVNGKEFEVNEDILRGIDNEDKALELLNIQEQCQFKPCCFESPKYPWAICSADGWDTKLALGAEIKCPRRFSKEIINYKEPPLKYKAQLQHSMMVTGSMHWYYCEYMDHIKYFLINRDENYIERLIKAEQEFHERLMSFDAPIHPYQDLWNSIGK